MSTENRLPSANVMKYNPQLDGLRFCAVLFVVCYHWLPSIYNLKIAGYFGGVVNFFFVLSSYLITSILFSAREKSIKLGIPRFKVILVFLMRRTIRIFPAYYFYLLLVLLLPIIGLEIKQHAAIYFGYLSNYHMFSGQVYSNIAAHLWTLAVEEQFYLLWPLLIIFIPYKHLLKTLVAIIIGTVVLRALTYHPQPVIPQAILTQYCVDSFAIGGLLTYMYRTSETERQMITRYFNWALYVLTPIGALIIILHAEYFSFVINRLLFAMLALKVIEGAVIGYKNAFGKFLQLKPVLYLGKISYGIYLYHLLVPVLFWKLYNMAFQAAKIAHPAFFERNQHSIGNFERVMVSEIVCFVIYSVLVILVATISWKYLETPLNKLKVSFNFDSKKANTQQLIKSASLHET